MRLQFSHQTEGFSRLSIRNHMGIQSIAVKMFIIQILPDQLFGVGALTHRGFFPSWGACAGIIPRTAPP